MLTQNELLVLYRLLGYFIDKSSSSTFHLPTTCSRNHWNSTRASNQSVNGSHRGASHTFLWLSILLPLLLFKYSYNKLALQKSSRTLLWHVTNSPSLIHGKRRYYQLVPVPFPTELGQERGARCGWGAPGFSGVYASPILTN